MWFSWLYIFVAAIALDGLMAGLCIKDDPASAMTFLLLAVLIGIGVVSEARKAGEK